MPTILTLQGPNLSLLGVGAVAPTDPVDAINVKASVGEQAVFAIKGHPWAILLGLFVGGFLASKYAPAWGGAWGAQHAARSRDRAVHGHSFFGHKLGKRRRRR